MIENPSLSEICKLIEARQPPATMTTKIVAIDGLGGAGKSTLAAALANALGAETIATDDFASPETPLDWDERLIAQVMTPLGQNQPAHYQRYDWHIRRLANWISVPAGKVILVEGVSSSRARFRPFLSMAIWIEVGQALRLVRGLARDGQAALPLWQTWQAEEDAYVTRENPIDKADVVLAGNQPLRGE